MVEMWKKIVLLVRSHKGNNRLSHTGRKSILYSGRKFCRIYSTVMQKIELVSDELGNLAEEISKECVGSADWFILATNSEMKVEGDRLR